MEDKIKKTLSIFDGLVFDVWFDNSVDCGIITIHHHCITSAILDQLSLVVDLVSISCTAPNCYNLTVMAKNC